MKETTTPRALITGACRGIGAAIGDIFIRNGYKVSLFSRNGATQDEQVARLGTSSQAIVCDITNPATVANTFASAIEKFGIPAILVNNAGAQIILPLEARSLTKFS